MFVLGRFWKTKSCILCKGFRLGERLGDMLLNSCNGGRNVWWAFLITPNKFEGLHEFFINVKLNQRTGNGKRKDAANSLPRWVWEDLHTPWEEAQTGTDKGLRQREMGWLWPDSELCGGEREKTRQTLDRIAAQDRIPKKWPLRHSAWGRTYHGVVYGYTM